MVDGDEFMQHELGREGGGFLAGKEQGSSI